MTLENEGTVSFWIKHQNPDWATNDSGYNFGPFAGMGIDVFAAKHPDKTLEVRVALSSKTVCAYSGPMPQASAKGVMVAVTWKRGGEIILYLNGEEAHSAPFQI